MFAVATSWLLTQLRKEEGQTMAEYGIILVLVAVVAAAAFTFLQGGITNTLDEVGTSLGMK